MAVSTCADKKLRADLLRLVDSFDAVRCMKGRCGFSFALHHKMLEHRKRVIFCRQRCSSGSAVRPQGKGQAGQRW